MTDDLHRDSLTRLVGGLGRAKPDAARAARVRERCQAALVARRTEQEQGRARRPAGVVLLGILGAVYLAEIGRQAIVIYLSRPI